MWIVTGANGFIGSQMVRELNQHGLDQIIAVDPVSQTDRPVPLQNKKIRQFMTRAQQWDFLQTDEAIENVTWVCHMGANSSTTETNWEHLLDVNVGDSQRLFEWCAKHQKSMIYASSAATYGAGELGYNDQTNSDDLTPLNLYGKSKVLFDRWALTQTKTPKHWYGLKFFNVYGPGEDHKGDQASVIFKSFHQINKVGKIQLFKSARAEYKDGEQMRDFIYVKDITKWMWELTEKLPTSGLYNMGTGQARHWKDLALATFSAMQKTSHIEFIEMPAALRDHYQYFTEANMQKWKNANMPASRWSLEQGIRDYVTQHLLKGES